MGVLKRDQDLLDRLVTLEGECVREYGGTSENKLRIVFHYHKGAEAIQPRMGRAYMDAKARSLAKVPLLEGLAAEFGVDLYPPNWQYLFR